MFYKNFDHVWNGSIRCICASKDGDSLFVLDRQNSVLQISIKYQRLVKHWATNYDIPGNDPLMYVYIRGKFLFY